MVESAASVEAMVESSSAIEAAIVSATVVDEDEQVAGYSFPSLSVNS